MSARMIHGRKSGNFFEESQAYDAYGRVSRMILSTRLILIHSRQYIEAIDRTGLNKRLLDALEKLPNVTFHFNHKLTGADFKKKVAWFEKDTQAWLETWSRTAQSPSADEKDQQLHRRPPEIEVDFDLLIGADGAHSATRYHIMKFSRITYEQEYIDTLWCEFHIPPQKGPNGTSFAISPHHLHIWPAGSFMFIAIPSLDQSFTCTLFAPSAHFESLSTDPSTRLPDFFNRHFPGVCPNLISHTDLLRQFRTNPHLPLISIKCRPYHYKSSAVILGDAAHAMVPFYGQGMNAGLEDVRVLFDILDKHGVYSDSHDTKSRAQAREAALNEYTVQRAPDAAAINDLALRNYEEMRSGVRSPIYKFRKWAEETATLYLPALGWRTQYTRVSFENQRYSEVVRDVKQQGQLLLGTAGISFTVVAVLAYYGLSRVGGLLRSSRLL